MFLFELSSTMLGARHETGSQAEEPPSRPMIAVTDHGDVIGDTM